MQGIVGHHAPDTANPKGKRGGIRLHERCSLQEVNSGEDPPGIRQGILIPIEGQDPQTVDRQDQRQAGACASADLKDGCLRVPDQRGHEFPFPEDAKLLPLSLARVHH
jgi:hypothetical protein